MKSTPNNVLVVQDDHRNVDEAVVSEILIKAGWHTFRMKISEFERDRKASSLDETMLLSLDLVIILSEDEPSREMLTLFATRGTSVCHLFCGQPREYKETLVQCFKHGITAQLSSDSSWKSVTESLLPAMEEIMQTA